MSHPDAAPRPVAPAAAVGAAVLAVVGALPVLYLALRIPGPADLGARRPQLRRPRPGVGAAPPRRGGRPGVGRVRLLRRRGWRLLAVACGPATAFVGWLVLDSASAGRPPPVGPLLVLLTPVVALGLAVTPRVRAWVRAG